MLHIILLILKIIGWILLAILGIVVLLVCVVLFTPLKYEARAKCAGKLSSLDAGVKFSYFLHLVSGTVRYKDEKLYWKLRIAWKRAGSGEETAEVVEESVEETAETAGRVVEETAKEAERAVDVKAEKTEEDADVKAEKTEKVEETADAEATVQKPERHTEKPKEDAAESGKAKEPHPKKTVEKQRESILDKLERLFEKIAYKFEQICDKIKMLIKKKDIVMGFLTDEAHTSAFTKVLSEGKRLLIRLKPKKICGETEFGFEDPAWTGKALAWLSMIYPFIGETVDLYPRFDEKILKGKLHIKGSVSPRVFLSMGLKLLFDKNIRATIRDIKNFKFE